MEHINQAPTAVPVKDELPFDINSLNVTGKNTRVASNRGAVLQLKDPGTQLALPLFMELVGRHGDDFKNHVKDRTDARIMAAHAAEQRGETLDPRLTADQERDGIELLAICTRRIFTRHTHNGVTTEHPLFILDGVRYDSNATGFLALYRDQEWVRIQADRFIGKVENFMTAS